MSQPRRIEIDRYRYSLPEELIARYPLPLRDQSGLLIYDRGVIEKRTFTELPEIIPAGTRLAFNKTKVIQARLYFRKPTGARIEIFCLEPFHPADYERAFRATGTCSWKCLVGNARKWKGGPVYLSLKRGDKELTVSALMKGNSGEGFTIQFSWDARNVTFGDILQLAGQTPIPPYLQREAEESDRERYQTVYSRDPGSVAAPTAGLHFTGEMIRRLEQKGIRPSHVTLHVGTGTFVPVKEKDAREHHMHTELVIVTGSFLEEWASHAEPFLAVGTTTVRSLESLYWLGVKILNGEEPDPAFIGLKQWEDESLPGNHSLEASLRSLLGYCRQHGLKELVFTTQLMVVPGYRFRTVSGLITNFHMPGSTLLLLIAAFIGEDWRKVYDFALADRFRFLSYGDSSLLLPGGWSGAQQ